MKRTIFMILLLWAVIILCITLAIVARAEKITLQWDTVEGVDGYYIYQFQKDETYDYTNPVKTVVYPDGKIPQHVDRLIIDLEGIAGQDTKYRWVARSFRGDEQSDDSNEVEYVVALTIPPAPNELAGSFDKEAGMINLSWVQPVETQSYRMISHFIVYCRQQGDEEWKAIGRINSDNELTLQAPISAIMSEEKATLEFTIVAYRRSGVYSHNSDILSLEIDRTKVPVIQNLRINIEIPVI